jgi:hypothetical protein
MEDGTLYRATKAGGKITVSDEHARDINKLRGNGEGGLINATFHEFGSGAGGRVCDCSPTVYYEWTKTCPRCGAETKPR